MSNRFEQSNDGATCFMSIDGTDFMIQEPTPRDKKWYSFKHNGPGLRYEIGLCIQTGKIVWALGGYHCGAYPDLKLAREWFVDEVGPFERVLADKGDRDYRFTTPYDCHSESAIRCHDLIMARHEHVNRRLKSFQVLKQVIRHDTDLHVLCFQAVVDIVEVMIENGSPLSRPSCL